MHKDMIVDSSVLHTKETTTSIMLDVLIALVPAAIFGVIIFGVYSAFIIAVCIISGLLFEYLWRLVFGLENSLGDLSAAVTGLLLALVLPPRIPFWIAIIGSFVAIIIVKQAFGGLGKNLINPAVFAKVLLMAVFPKSMTSYVEPFGDLASNGEAVSYGIKELIFGTRQGNIGETSVILLLIGVFYLMLRGVVNPIIPASFIGTVALLNFVFGNNVLLFVCSGGLIIAACFMATDSVTTPVSNLGKLIFGVCCGIISFFANKFLKVDGSFIAILVMNLFVPLLEKYIRHKPFGLTAKE